MHPFVQLLKLSGILTMLFCGIVMSHYYAWYNIAEIKNHNKVTLYYVSHLKSLANKNS
jgi:hypothetical protein